LGAEHLDTLRARANLALAYGATERVEEAGHHLEAVLVDRMRLLGLAHPDTLRSQMNLALNRWEAGHAETAIAMLGDVLAQAPRVWGAQHPDTMSAQGVLQAMESAKGWFRALGGDRESSHQANE
jgi:hypothetical protein